MSRWFVSTSHSKSIVRDSRLKLLVRNMGGQSQEASTVKCLFLTGIRSAIQRRVPWQSPKRNVMATGLARSMPIAWNTVIRVLVPISI